MRALGLAYGVVSYAVFFASFLYAMGFVGNLVVEKGIDSGTEESTAMALLVDVVLLLLFAIPHSVMARRSFKEWWTRFIPNGLERSTYVLVSSLLLLLLYWQWRPLTDVVWHVDAPAARSVLLALYWSGWALVLVSSFLIDHFGLFGLRQAWAWMRGTEWKHPGFRAPLLYKFVRHPLLLGFLIAFWATPDLTLGHLLFSVATTGYVLVGILFEERDLVAALGAEYVKYRREVPMLLPLPRKKAD